MRRAALLLLVGLNLVLLALFAAQTNPAHAHPADNYIRTWPINSTEDYYFDDDVPNGWRDHVQFGLDQWSNRVNGRAPNFVRSGEVNRVLDYAHFCAGPHSYVYARGDWQATFGGLAGTVLCESPPAKFVMVFEETPTSGAWFAGATDPPNDRWDLRSIATHESGHSAGFDVGFDAHFSESGDACPADNQARSTMCPGRSGDLGTMWMRSLADDHDLHTLWNAYQ